MKSTLIIVFATILTLTCADELSECGCWSGYEPKKDQDGVKCYGIKLLHTRRCNEPQRPGCACSGEVTGILSDSSGIWCSSQEAGEDRKKWACENQEDWKRFYEQYPNEKP